MNASASVWGPGWRASALKELKNNKFDWDLLVVGGGITGAGIYHQAAARGLRVLLVEQQDFAWGTSSRSSKMVHGGLRYLGSGQFTLARDSVTQRQALLEELPGLVDPLPFVMPHYRGGFPGPWIFDKLLRVYDWMAGFRARKFIDAGLRDFWVPGLKQRDLVGGTRFADAVTDDARLVMRVLHEGNRAGGQAFNYLKATQTLHTQEHVKGVVLEDQVSGENFKVQAKVIVNASGAWTDQLRAQLGHEKLIRPLRGSHLVVPLWRLPVAFSVSFFHPQDKRPVFVFPWEGTAVIGTTDLDHKASMEQEASINEQEMEYLLTAANHAFEGAQLQREDVISTWSGVRPVVSKDSANKPDLSKPVDPSDEKREHAIWRDDAMISVAGGKLTTYRLIALDVLREAMPLLSGKLNEKDLDTPLAFESIAKAPGMGQQRLLGRYGYDIHRDFPDALAQQRVQSTDTYWCELMWACRHESVEHLDDLLLRRTRIGLLVPEFAAGLKGQLRKVCMEHLQWDAQRFEDEWVRYLDIACAFYGLPVAGEGA